MKIDKFRANLKSRIKEIGYTQEEFANKINISNAALKKYMSNGKNTSIPDIEIFDRMCTVLECDYDYLMGEIDSPRKCVHDVKQVIGLSDEAINILADTYKESKPTFDFSNMKDELRLALLEIDERRSSVYKEKLSVIDFIIKNGEDTKFLWHMYMYLFSDFTVENESDISLYNTLNLTDKNSGYTIHFDPSIAKEALLTKITYQLQKWKEEIEIKKPCLKSYIQF